MLAINIAKNTFDSNSPEKLQNVADSRQKRYTSAQKAEFIHYMTQRELHEKKSNLTWYAERQGVSRSLLYALHDEFVNTFGPLTPGPKKQSEIDDKAVANAESGVALTQERIIKSILQAAVSPMSSSDIQQQLRVSFGLEMSKRKIKKIIAHYSDKAAQILQSLNLEQLVKNMAIDEIFCAGHTVLTGVELVSMTLVINKIAPNRDHKTWHQELERFDNLETISSDRATGIIKGVELCGNIDHQFDLFHFKRDAYKQLRRLESKAYDKIDLEYRAQAKLGITTSIDCIGYQLEYQKCHQNALEAIECFEKAEKAMNIIDQALEIFDQDGNLCDLSKNLYALDQGANLLEKSSSERKIKNLAAQIRDPRLRLYLGKLRQRFLDIAIKYNPECPPMPRNKLFGIIAASWYWKQQKPHSVSAYVVKEQRRSARKQAQRTLYIKQIAASLQLRQVQMTLANFEEVVEQVVFALNNVFRSSSLVESINSTLRLYQQVKKSLSKSFLALLSLYWNMHQFSDGKRKNKSPFQILGIQGEKDSWLDLLLAA